MYDDDAEVRPDGLTVRRLRHERGWSPRDLCSHIEARRFAATGLRSTVSPNLLAGIEERDERVPYAVLCLVSDAFDCDPIDLVNVDQRDPADDGDEAGGDDESGAGEARDRARAPRARGATRPS